ncbi:CUT domain [Trinorchestia longiramus]|nr:CUT domain [Trinorchestia longiramus]
MLEISKLEDDIFRLRTELSGMKEASSMQVHSLEEQIEEKNRQIKRLELRLENKGEIIDKIGNGRETLGLTPRPFDSLLSDRTKGDFEMKVPSSDFGHPPHGSHPLHQPLRPSIHPHHLGNPLAPPPLVSPLQPLAPHPPPSTAHLHHLLGEEWRRSFERNSMERHSINSGVKKNFLDFPRRAAGQMSPDSGGIVGLPASGDRTDSRESPLGDSLMKSPSSSLPNGFPSESKSPFQCHDDRPFKDEFPPHLGFKFEDRITGESLIPKGDPMEARLQEILRFNMDKYCHQSLDTLQLSRRIRELLSIHNIGQRLFAKYVLGLSQGTVSELLSKPKLWDKLTEKGRDSYRKMHAWATDDNAVFLLKSLIPKRGKS